MLNAASVAFGTVKSSQAFAPFAAPAAPSLTTAPMGSPLVACTCISSGPGDLVTYVDGREAALGLETTFVPVDATIMGFVEQATRLGEVIGREEA